LADADGVYSPSRAGPLRQGEVLSGLRQVVPVAGSIFENLRVDIIEHRFAVILSQDCDLEQDFNARAALKREPEKYLVHSRRQLLNVLFCDAVPTDELKTQINDPRVWEPAVQNRNERFQFLRAVKPEQDSLGEGIPTGLGLDFKRYFSVLTEEVYAQAEHLNNRRRVLVTPYAEHLSVRFAFYQSRIPLPKPHHAT